MRSTGILRIVYVRFSLRTAGMVDGKVPLAPPFRRCTLVWAPGGGQILLLVPEVRVVGEIDCNPRIHSVP